MSVAVAIANCKDEYKYHWMRTCDLGYLDGTGCLYRLGRVSDYVRTGGEPVIAVQLERVVTPHGAGVDSVTMNSAKWFVVPLYQDIPTQDLDSATGTS
jgi:acyl-CoA synthetase (AMP-forming)/AMP-acid ligase II